MLLPLRCVEALWTLSPVSTAASAVATSQRVCGMGSTAFLAMAQPAADSVQVELAVLAPEALGAAVRLLPEAQLEPACCSV